MRSYHKIAKLNKSVSTNDTILLFLYIFRCILYASKNLLFVDCIYS